MTRPWTLVWMLTAACQPELTAEDDAGRSSLDGSREGLDGGSEPRPDGGRLRDGQIAIDAAVSRDAGDATDAGMVVVAPGTIVVDHTSIALFDRIPASYLMAAGALRQVFSDRSVGQNINESLDCLTAPTFWESPSACRRDYVDRSGDLWTSTSYGRAEYEAGTVPARIRFDPDPVAYDRSNWMFEFRMGTWDSLVENFVTDIVPSYVDTTDVLSFQFSYLNIAAGDTIDDDANGFFADLPSDAGPRRRWDISDIEDLEARYPTKLFIYWTTSLARGIGTVDGMRFNRQMRDYVRARGKVLFDVADIESHTDTGVPCFDNRDGVRYCSSADHCEDHADDGMDIPAICQDYTSEIEGGHLGSVSAGRILVAKAFWVLMARIAGWDGS